MPNESQLDLRKSGVIYDAEERRRQIRRDPDGRSSRADFLSRDAGGAENKQRGRITVYGYSTAAFSRSC